LLVFAFLPVAVALAVGTPSYLLAANDPGRFGYEILYLLTFGLPVAFGASMRKVRGFVMSVVVVAAAVVGSLAGQGDVGPQFDDGGFFIVVIAAALTIFVLAFWLLGVVIGSVWRWARRRWST
jgi:hypothetical protein